MMKLLFVISHHRLVLLLSVCTFSQCNYWTQALLIISGDCNNKNGLSRRRQPPPLGCRQEGSQHQSVQRNSILSIYPRPSINNVRLHMMMDSSLNDKDDRMMQAVANNETLSSRGFGTAAVEDPPKKPQQASSLSSMKTFLSKPTPASAATTVSGPSSETKPVYEDIVGPLGKWMDTVFMVVFRYQLAQQVPKELDSNRPLNDYQGIVELAARMNRRFRDRTKVQQRAQETLRSLFPSWLPKQYAILFSQPFPAFAARMNAWATYVAGTWLMGECQVNDIVLDNGDIGKHQGLLVKRCRFLEESQCASVCVNSCKIPTQNFFLQDMGLPLTMEPNYDTFECQFSFGKAPNAETERLAQSTPCLMRCPAAGSLRQEHDAFFFFAKQTKQKSSETAAAATVPVASSSSSSTTTISSSVSSPQAVSVCKMMGNTDYKDEEAYQ